MTAALLAAIALAAVWTITDIGCRIVYHHQTRTGQRNPERATP